MELFKGQNLLEFTEQFKNGLRAKEYLVSLKRIFYVLVISVQI